MHPAVRGILVDLPSTIARSGRVFHKFGVSERTTLVGQSFFEPLPAGADVYILKSILSNWPDYEATTILKRCAEAAAPTGRVVVLTGISPDDPMGPQPAVLMMVLYGGRNRTLSQFRELAHAARLEVIHAEKQSSDRFVVECCPTL